MRLRVGPGLASAGMSPTMRQRNPRGERPGLRTCTLQRPSRRRHRHVGERAWTMDLRTPRKAQSRRPPARRETVPRCPLDRGAGGSATACQPPNCSPWRHLKRDRLRHAHPLGSTRHREEFLIRTCAPAGAVGSEGCSDGSNFPVGRTSSWFGLASWLLLVAVIVALFTQLKGDYNDNFKLPEIGVDDRPDLSQGPLRRCRYRIRPRWPGRLEVRLGQGHRDCQRSGGDQRS